MSRSVRFRERRRPGRSGYTMLALLFGLTLVSAGTSGDRTTFLRELAAVERVAAGGDHGGAGKQLLVLLEAHEGEVYAIAELKRIRSVLGAAAFAERYGERPLAELLRGELLAHDVEQEEVHLHLHLRFEDGRVDGGAPLAGLEHAPGDLEWASGLWWYPVPFGGPGTLTLRGRVPEATESERPVATLYARLSLGDEHGVRTTFDVAVGALGTDGAAPVRALQQRGEETELLEEANERPLAAGSEYELELRVTRRRLFLRSGGETILSTRRPKDLYGRFGWVDLPGLEELELEGEIEADWLKELPARHRSAAREAWLLEETPDLGLPAWIVEWLVCKPPLGTEEDAALFDQYEELLAAGEYEVVLGRVDSKEAAKCKPWFRDWYRYRCLKGLGRHEEALEMIDRVLARTPRFELAVTGRAGLLDQLGAGRLSSFYRGEEYREGLAWIASEEGRDLDPFARAWYSFLFHEKLGLREEAAASLDAALSARPDYAPGLEFRALSNWEKGLWSSALDQLRSLQDRSINASINLAYCLLKTGRLEEAREVADSIEDATDENAGWTDLLELLERAAQAPELEDAKRYEGRDCVIVSRLVPRHCRAAVETFDGTRELVAAHVGRQPEGEEPHERVPCYIFHSPEYFQFYCREVLEVEYEAWGAHNEALWQVIVQWRLPKDSLRTVRHEAVHNYLSRRFAYPPIWLHEGLACYLSTARLEGGTVHFEEEKAERYRRLYSLVRDEPEWTPYAQLLSFESEEFMVEAGRHYAQALALVHYLNAGGEEAGGVWQRLVEVLDEGGEIEEVAALILAAVPDLDDRVRAHLRSLGL